jgi:hypothetical protein
MPADRKYEPRALLELVGSGRRGSELVPQIRERFGCGKTQAYEWLQSCVAGDLLDETPLPGKGRPKLYEITSKGQQLLADPGPMDSRLGFAFRKGKRARKKTTVPSPTTQKQAKGSEVGATVSEQIAKRPRGPARRRDPEHLRIERYRRNSDINGFYRLWFGGRTARYIQLLTPVEKAIEGGLWRLPVGFDDDGLQLFASIIAEEDKADPLKAVVPQEWRAPERFVLPAVELISEGDGFEIAQHKDESGLERPSVGVICESMRIFLNPLEKVKPNGRIIQVKGEGPTKTRKSEPDKRRRFEFEDVAEALPLTVSFDFEAFLHDLADPRHEQRVLELPVDWFGWWPEQRRRYWEQIAIPPPSDGT